MRHVAGSGEGTTTTCAGTSVPAATVRTMLASTSVGSLASVCTTALFDGIEDVAESKVVSTERLKRLMDTTNKLSPKVYCGQTTKSLVHSLEDINSGMEYARPPYCHSYSGKSDKPRPWGSLQEIRNFRSSVSDNCIVRFFRLIQFMSFLKKCSTKTNGYISLSLSNNLHFLILLQTYLVIFFNLYKLLKSFILNWRKMRSKFWTCIQLEFIFWNAFILYYLVYNMLFCLEEVLYFPI